MKTSSAVALFLIFITTLATSALARPNLPTYDSEEYTDNNVVDSMPMDEHDDDDLYKNVKPEYLEM